MLRHYPFRVAGNDDRRMRAPVWRDIRTDTVARNCTQAAYRAPVRPESKHRRSPASPRLDLSRECMSARTRTREHARKVEAKARQSGGRFDVAAAAATFATLNTFISRSGRYPSFFRVVQPRSPVPLSLSLLLCSCTTLPDFVPQFISVPASPRGLNFTPCRGRRV